MLGRLFLPTQLFMAIAFAVLLTICVSSAARAENPIILSDEVVAPEVMNAGTQYLRDASRALGIDDVRQGDAAAGFRPLETGFINFGYIKDAVWLRFEVINPNDDDQWRIHFRENFFPEFAVWSVMPDGQVTQYTDITPDKGFRGRSLPYPELVSPITLPRDVPVTVYVRYRSGGASETSFDVLTEAAFDERAARRTAKNFIYYGMMLILVIASSVAFIGTSRTVFAAYALYASSGLLFVMHGDGNTFRYLWPNAPEFNAYASVLLGVAIIFCGPNFARSFLQTDKHNPILDRVLLATMLMPLVTMACTLFIDTQVIKKLLVLEAFFCMIMMMVSGLVAARTRFREVRFYIAAWTGAVISSAIMTMRHWIGLDISAEVQFDSMRMVLVLDAGLMGFAIQDRFNQLKQNRQHALEASLAEAEENVRLSKRLQHLELQYEMAEQLAQARNRTLADTAHDLRQPLHALRLNVNALLKGGAKQRGDLDEVEKTFDYVQQLLSRELETASLESQEQDVSVVDIGEVLTSVGEMLGPDAEAAGVDLRIIPSSQQATIAPLAVMRIVSNLVSNAIKYGGAGKVLVGVRRINGRVVIEVHDTGPGLSEDAFQHAVSRHVRLDTAGVAQGNGLGLSIVSALAQEHGAEFSRLPRRTTGLSVRVVFP